MHSPEVMAFEIKRPWPKITKASKTGLQVRYKWAKWYDLRPSSFQSFWTIGPMEWYWPGIAVIWHMEPGGLDANTVCKINSHWRWHIHHWSIQVFAIGNLRKVLFERCLHCGGKYRWNEARVSHNWYEPKSKWFKVQRRSYHRGCSDVVHLKNQLSMLEESLRHLRKNYPDFDEVLKRQEFKYWYAVERQLKDHREEEVQ